MKIRVGFDIQYECIDFTPIIFMLNVHPSRVADLLAPDRLDISPPHSITPYLDGFGNKCLRILACPGELKVANATIVTDSGKPDPVNVSRPSSMRLLTFPTDLRLPPRQPLL
jgi:hypothetical protein